MQRVYAMRPKRVVCVMQGVVDGGTDLTASCAATVRTPLCVTESLGIVDVDLAGLDRDATPSTVRHLPHPPSLCTEWYPVQQLCTILYIFLFLA